LPRGKGWKKKHASTGKNTNSGKEWTAKNKKPRKPQRKSTEMKVNHIVGGRPFGQEGGGHKQEEPKSWGKNRQPWSAWGSENRFFGGRNAPKKNRDLV